MQEFKIEEDGRRREDKITGLSCGALLLPLLIVALLMVIQGVGFLTGTDLGPFVVTAAVCIAIGVFLLAVREALNRADRQMTFVLEDNQITGKRPGYPEVTIALSDIVYLREELKWLIVRSAFPLRKFPSPRMSADTI